MSAIRILGIAAFCVVIALCSTAEAKRATHIRLRTPQGPVHVWTPAKFDRETAGIVVYVHGYFTDVDGAWKKHQLARQFAESGLNALFIACEAPKGPREDVHWTSIDDLLELVADQLGDALPGGRVTVVGHSGAHRTIAEWLGSDVIDTLVLVDALYGEKPELHDWLDADEDRRLIDVAKLTRRTDALHAELPDTLVFNRFPPARAGKLRGARNARVVYVRSQHDHMSLITGGIALPMLLRAVKVPVVENASRRAPIRAL